MREHENEQPFPKITKCYIRAFLFSNGVSYSEDPHHNMNVVIFKVSIPYLDSVVIFDTYYFNFQQWISVNFLQSPLFLFFVIFYGPPIRTPPIEQLLLKVT